jgi:hypothetical protein
VVQSLSGSHRKHGGKFIISKNSHGNTNQNLVKNTKKYMKGFVLLTTEVRNEV